MITKEIVEKYITYNPITGEMYRLRDSYRTFTRKRLIRSGDRLGRVYIHIEGTTYMGHRLAWLLSYGYMPSIIDHIDCNPSNNALSNLREVTQLQNCWNRSKENIKGTKGLSEVLHRNGTTYYQGRVMSNGKRVMKSSKNKEEILNWLRETRQELHREFANHG